MKTAKIIIAIIVLVFGLLPLEGTLPTVQAAPERTDLTYRLFLPMVEAIIPPPTLLSPESGSMFYTAIDLTWTPVPGACEYAVYASNGSFQFIEKRNETRYSFFDPGDWTWKVRAVYCHDLGRKTEGPWSLSRNFTVIASDFMTLPSVYGPEDGSEVHSGKPPLFEVMPASLPLPGWPSYYHDKIQLQIAHDSDFNDILWDSSGTPVLVFNDNVDSVVFRYTRQAQFSFIEQSFEVLDPMPERSYYWRARDIATDGITISDWSEVRSFSVVKPYEDCYAPGPFEASVSSAQIPGYPHIGYLIVDNNAPDTGEITRFLIEAGVYPPAVYPIDRVTVQVIYNTGITQEYEGTLIYSYDAFVGRWQVDVPMPGTGCYNFIMRISVHNALGSQVIIVENKPHWR